MEDNFDVVDHQVEDDADIGAAVWVGRESSDLQEAGILELGFKRVEDRVETLDVADLQDATFGGSEGRHLTGMRRGVGDRLFDKQVLSAFEKERGELVVGDRRCANRRGINETGKFFERGSRFDIESFCDGGGGFGVAVVDGGQRAQFAVDAGVVDAHVADSDDSCSDVSHNP